MTKLSYGNLFIDVDAEDHYVKNKAGDKNKEFLYRYYEGLTGSKYEGIIWAEGSKDKTEETVCTVSVLGQAMETGIEIHQFDKENKEGLEETLAKLSLSDSEKSRIKQDIEAGHLITIPDEDVTIGSWTGTGYISLDKTTGAGAYMISGSLNGGEHPFYAYSVAVLAVYMEYLSSKVLVNVLMSVLVPGVIKLLGAALIVTSLFVLHMMMIAYADYMFEGGEDRLDKFIEWAMASSFMSSLQMQFAWLVMSMFGLNVVYEEEKGETNAESEATPETNPEMTLETDPETTPEANSGTVSKQGGFGESINVSDKKMHQLGEHFNKHGRDMGYLSKKEYDAAAREFFYKNKNSCEIYRGVYNSSHGERKGDIQLILRQDGFQLIIDEKTGQIIDFYEGESLSAFINLERKQ